MTKNNAAAELAREFYKASFGEGAGMSAYDPAVPELMVRFAQAQTEAAVKEVNVWTKWDWDDASTWPLKDGEYICNDGYSDSNSYVIDTWDSSREEFIHYQIYGFWRPLLTVEHKEFAAEIKENENGQRKAD